MILKWFFDILSGESNINWLSMQYARYKSKKLDDYNRRYKESAKEEHLFEVPGAGEIMVSEHCNSRCGQAIGFSIGVSWGTHGFCGGVIGRDEAQRLSNYLLKKISECPETETEERIRREKEYQTLQEQRPSQSNESSKEL